MIHLAVAALLGVLTAAQQPQVQQEELPKPGQTQPVQPEQKPAPKQAAPEQHQQQETPAQQPDAQPAPQPEAAPQPAPRPAPGTTQHVPASEERERRDQGKPVAAFWTVIPGK